MLCAHYENTRLTPTGALWLCMGQDLESLFSWYFRDDVQTTFGAERKLLKMSSSRDYKLMISLVYHLNLMLLRSTIEIEIWQTRSSGNYGINNISTIPSRLPHVVSWPIVPWQNVWSNSFVSEIIGNHIWTSNRNCCTIDQMWNRVSLTTNSIKCLSRISCWIPLQVKICEDESCLRREVARIFVLQSAYIQYADTHTRAQLALCTSICRYSLNRSVAGPVFFCSLLGCNSFTHSNKKAMHTMQCSGNQPTTTAVVTRSYCPSLHFLLLFFSFALLSSSFAVVFSFHSSGFAVRTADIYIFSYISHLFPFILLQDKIPTVFLIG